MSLMIGKQDFSWPTTVVLNDDAVGLEKFVEENRSRLNEKKLVVFGAGIRGSVFAVLLKKLNVNNLCFVDNNQDKWGGMIHGFEIYSPALIKQTKEQYLVLIAIENSKPIVEQLKEFGYVQGESLFTVDTEIYDSYIREMLAKKRTRNLILGDCGFTQISIKDENKKNLGQLLAEKLGEEETKVLAMHGMGMRGFYNTFCVQLELNPEIEKVLLMVNFEVFTGRHHLLPRTQHSPLFQKMGTVVPENSEELREYIALTAEREQKLLLDVSSQTNNGNSGSSNAHLVFRMNYMYRLKTNIEDMVYLDKLLNLAIEKGITVKPFIPAANYQYAEEVLGTKFKEKYDQNRWAMVDFIKKYGVETLDLSYQLRAEEFADLTTVDESANYAGRLILAKELFDFFTIEGLHEK